MTRTGTSGLKSGMYQGNNVTLLELPEPKIRPPTILVREAAAVCPTAVRGVPLQNNLGPLSSTAHTVLQVYHMRHNNVQKILGLSINDEGLCEYIVGDPCPKGTLTNLLKRITLRLDWPFRHSLIKDIAAVNTE